MKETEENHTHVDEESISTVSGCVTIIITLLFWWIIISHLIMRFQNPSMTETQLFLNLPKAFVLDAPVWGLEKD